MEVTLDELGAMRAAGPFKEYYSAEQPLVTLIRDLTKRTDRNFIQVEKAGVTITLSQGAPA